MVEDIPKGEEVLMCTFLLVGHLVIILFDSRASHDCMSPAFAKIAKLSLTVAKPSYMISTPGDQVVAKNSKRSSTRVSWESCLHPPHCLGWTRDRCYFRNMLGEATQSYSGYS
jgi:hypothetical protein